MPFPVVYVEVVPGGGADAVAALEEACSAAYSRGRCVVGAPARDEGMRARVRWQPGESSADVAIEGQPGRVLSFSEEDAVMERWRAVGLILGTLARDAPERRNEPTVRAPVRPRAELPRASSKGVSPRSWLSIAALAGPMGSGWRYGGSLRASHAVATPAFGLLGVRYSLRARGEHGVALGFMSASIGAGLRWPVSGTLDLSPRLELVGELTRATADDGTRSASESRTALGARGGLELGYHLSGSVELEAGGDASYIGGPIDLRVHSREVETLPAWSVSATLGVRWVLR